MASTHLAGPAASTARNTMPSASSLVAFAQVSDARRPASMVYPLAGLLALAVAEWAAGS